MRLFASFSHLVCSRREIEADVVAGGETAGIPFAAFVAQSLSVPMVYVRKEIKGHGIANLVEGSLPKTAEVVLVEDLITDGGSKMGFVNALKACGATVRHVIVLFDRLQGGQAALAAHGIQLHALCDMDAALQIAEADDLLTSEQVGTVRRYMSDPRKWHVEKGLPYSEGPITKGPP